MMIQPNGFANHHEIRPEALNPTVLVADYEPQTAQLLGRYLSNAGYRMIEARDGQSAIATTETEKPDLILMDLSLPKKDGMEVLRRVRAQGRTPVIMLTAVSDVDAKVAALRTGADDYIVKPFHPHEVLARANSVLCRCGRGWRSPMHHGAAIEIDNAGCNVFVVDEGCQRRLVDLTPTEYRIVSYMAAAPTMPCTRAQLGALVGKESTSARLVDAHISNIRKKLLHAGATGILESVRGVGYRLCRPA